MTVGDDYYTLVTSLPHVCKATCCPTATWLAPDGRRQRPELQGTSFRATSSEMFASSLFLAQKSRRPRPSQDVRPKAKQARLTNTLL